MRKKFLISMNVFFLILSATQNFALSSEMEKGYSRDDVAYTALEITGNNDSQLEAEGEQSQASLCKRNTKRFALLISALVLPGMSIAGVIGGSIYVQGLAEKTVELRNKYCHYKAEGIDDFCMDYSCLEKYGYSDYDYLLCHAHSDCWNSSPNPYLMCLDETCLKSAKKCKEYKKYYLHLKHSSEDDEFENIYYNQHNGDIFTILTVVSGLTLFITVPCSLFFCTFF